MLKFVFYFTFVYIFIIYGTGCSVIKNSQSSSHPLVHEVERNSISFKSSKNKFPKNSKNLVQDVEEKKNIEKVSEVKIAKKTEEITVRPKAEIIEKNHNKNSIEAKGQAKSLVEEAQKYLGTPYKIGGTNKSGMDCSGLVMTVYQTQGIQLPRISPDQYKFGKPISVDEIQPGDLLFFSTPSKPHQIGHSAMCVAIEDGKIKFIHAASTGVRYDYLVPGYYLTHYKGACRVLDKSLSFSK